MSIENVYVVAAREVRQRWPLAAVALVLGLVPLVSAALWPALREGARPLVAVEFIVAQGAVAFVGLTLFGDDAVSGRLGWYFSRPLSGLAIWAGRGAGTALLAIAASFLLVAPTLTLVRKLTPTEGFFDGVPLGNVLGFVVIPTVFLAVGVVGGIIARGRSRWTLVDLGGVLVMQPLIILTSERLHVLHRNPAFAAGAEVMNDLALAIAVVAFVGASAAGVLLGRTDTQRAHAAASVTLWGILVPAGAVMFSYARWAMG